MELHKCFVIETMKNKKQISKVNEVEELIRKSGFLNLSKFDAYRQMNLKDQVMYTFLKKEFKLPLKRNISGLYLIPVTIHDKKYSFLLDTGAQISGIVKHHVSKITEEIKEGIQLSSFGGKSKKMQSIICEQLQVGELCINNLPLTILDFEKYSLSSFIGIDGILGWDILSMLDFEIDGKKKEFRVIETQEDVEANMVKATFPLMILRDFRNRHCVVGLDSGARIGWLNMNYAKEMNLAIVDEGDSLSYGVHGVEKFHYKLIKEVRFKLESSFIVLKYVPTGKCELYPGFEADAVLGNEIFKNRTLRVLNSKNYMCLTGGNHE